MSEDMTRERVAAILRLGAQVFTARATLDVLAMHMDDIAESLRELYPCVPFEPDPDPDKE
jgi:hypothetical protein